MGIIEIIKVLFLGIVEGITEWLPISSTGHMILVDEFIKLKVTDEFKEMFFVVIQLGAIMAVVVLYWNKIFPFNFKKKNSNKVGFINMDIMNLWFKVLVATIPAAVVGILFEDKIDELFYNYQVVSITLIVYGIIFIIIENKKKGSSFAIQDMSQLSYRIALIIGFFQVLALIPGTSRSGATIVGGMLLGTSRVLAAEFTFYLAIPVMFGASLLKLIKFGLDFTGSEIAILILGMTTAYVVSIMAIKFLIGYIKNNSFKVFGYYRIVLGIVVIFYFLLRSFI